MSKDIKLDDSYEKFLKKNNSSVSLNVSLSFENDDYSHLSVKSNMNDIKSMLSQIYKTSLVLMQAILQNLLDSLKNWMKKLREI